MDLLTRIGEDYRQRLEAAAVTILLPRGQVLLRRGERGGDVYRVLEGRLEVIDSSSDPPVVLDQVGQGAFLGEMAFLDESVRSADVRAAEESTCQHWPRQDLLRLLHEDPAMGLAFYRALALLVNERSREFRVRAVREGLGLKTGPGASGQGTGPEAVLLQALRRQLAESESRSRVDREGARLTLRAALDRFASELSELVQRQERLARAATLSRVGEELHPWLVRSTLAELSIDRPQGRTEEPLALAHLLRAVPAGDGAIGEFLDEWLLGLPTAQALRTRASALRKRALELAPRKLLVINGAASGAAMALAKGLDARSSVRVVENDRALLSLIDANQSGARIALYHDDLAAVALGEGRLDLGAHDLVVIDALVDYLPDRAAARLLGEVRRCCAPRGRVLISALHREATGRSYDSLTFDHLLRWPLVRRNPEVLTSMLLRAGFVEVRPVHSPMPGLVLEASG